MSETQEEKIEKTVCGYAFRNTKTGLFATKGLNGWHKKPHIWNKDHYIKALITSKIKDAKHWNPSSLSSLKESFMDCEIIEVIIESGRSQSMLFNLDWLEK